MDFIDNECFNDPTFVKNIYKHIAFNNYWLISNTNAERLAKCFTIHQLYCIYKNSRSKTYSYVYFDKVLTEMFERHKYKKLVSYRYYVKRILVLYSIYAGPELPKKFDKHIRNIYECFNINLQTLMYNKNKLYPEIVIDCFIGMSYKQFKTSVSVVMRGNSEVLGDMIRCIRSGEYQPNVIFLKCLLKYHPDYCKRIILNLSCYDNVGVALFTEKYFPEIKDKLVISNFRFYEYLVRSKRCNDKNLRFDLIKKILEKFSTKNICKMILYF